MLKQLLFSLSSFGSEILSQHEDFFFGCPAYCGYDGR